MRPIVISRSSWFDLLFNLVPKGCFPHTGFSTYSISATERHAQGFTGGEKQEIMGLAVAAQTKSNAQSFAEECYCWSALEI